MDGSGGTTKPKEYSVPPEQAELMRSQRIKNALRAAFRSGKGKEAMTAAVEKVKQELGTTSGQPGDVDIEITEAKEQLEAEEARRVERRKLQIKIALTRALSRTLKQHELNQLLKAEKVGEVLSRLAAGEQSTQAAYKQLLYSLETKELRQLIAEAKARNTREEAQPPTAQNAIRDIDTFLPEGAQGESETEDTNSKQQKDLIKSLARMSAASLNERAMDLQARKADLTAQQESMDPDEYEGYLKVIDIQLRNIAQARQLRYLQNFDLLYQIDTNPQVNSVNLPEDVREKLEKVKEKIKAESNNSWESFTGEEAEGTLADLENLRLAVEDYLANKGKEGGEGETSGLKLVGDAEHLKVEKKRTTESTIEEIVDLLPRTQLARLAEKAAQGDKDSLNKYCELLKTGAYRQMIEEELAQYPEGQTPPFVAEIRSMLGRDSLGDEEQIYLFTLTSGMNPYLDARYYRDLLQAESQEQGNDSQRGVLAKLRLKLEKLKTITPDGEPPAISEGLHELSVAVNSGDLNKLRELAKSRITGLLEERAREITAGYLPPERESINNRILSELTAIVEVDADHQRSLASFESRTQQLRLDLVSDVVDKWVASQNPDRALYARQPENSPDKDSLLTMHMLRSRLNLYELTQLNLSDADERRSFKDEVKEAVGGKKLAVVDLDGTINWLVDQIHTNGVTMLYAWAQGDEQRINSNPDAVKITDQETLRDRAALVELIEWKLIEKGRDNAVQYAGEESSVAADKLAGTIVLARQFREADSDDREAWERVQSDPEQMTKLQEHIALQLIQNKLALKSSADASAQDAQDAAEAELEKLKKALADQNLALSDLFTVERVPGGFAARFTNTRLMNELLGTAGYFKTTDEDGQDIPVAGAVIKKAANFSGESTINLADGRLVVYDATADRHEVSHLIEKQLMGRFDSQESTFQRYGLDEIIAKLNTPSQSAMENANGQEILDYQKRRDIEMADYLPSLINIGVVNQKLIDELRDASPEQAAKMLAGDKIEGADGNDFSEYEKARLVFAIHSMVKDVSVYYAELKDDAEKREDVRQLLASILYDCNNTGSLTDLENVARELMISFPEVFDSHGINAVDLVAKGDEAQNLVEKYLGNVKERYKKINIFTGELITEGAEVQTALASTLENLKALQKARERYDFSMLLQVQGDRTPRRILGINVGSRPGPIETVEGGAGSADALAWDRLLREHYIDKQSDTFGNQGEIKSKPGLADLTINRHKNWSRWGEREPIRFIPGGGILNPLIGTVARSVFNFNTRDIAGAVGGTDLGKAMGVSSYKSSNGGALVETFVGKPFGLYVKKNYSGWVERTTTEGHRYPDFVRDLQLKDRHTSAITALTEKLNGKVSQTEIFSFLETHPLMQLEIVPGDRPNFNQEVSEKKADQITEFELRRIKSEVTDRRKLEENGGDKKLAYGPGRFRIGDIAFSPYVLPDGTYRMKVKLGNGRTLDRPFSETEVVRIAGDEEVKKKGAAFYSDWRPQVVRYKGGKYFVHYDPKTGMPGLYTEEHIDWSARRLPQPLKDGDKLVEPRFCEPFRKVGGERHKQNMNIAVDALMQQILDIRKKQIAVFARNRGVAADEYVPTVEEERQLYSLKDLIQSIRYYEDPYSQGDGDPRFCTTKKVNNGIGEITLFSIKIPNINDQGVYTGTFAEVDYEVANELISRVERFYISDKIERSAIMKNINPEFIQTEEYIPTNSKVRGMLAGYFRALLNRNFINPANPDAYLSSDEIERLAQDSIRRADELRAIDRPSDAQRQELARHEDIVRSYTELVEYENMIMGQYNLFDEDLKRDKTSFRDHILRNLGAETMQAFIAIRGAVEAQVNAIAGIQPSERARIMEEYEQIIMELLVSDQQNTISDQRRVYNLGGSLTAIYINKMLNFDTPAAELVGGALNPRANPRDYTRDYSYIINAINAAPLPGTTINLPVPIALPAAIGGQYDPDNVSWNVYSSILNKQYDKRVITRMMRTIPPVERERLASDIMGGYNDQLKYRQESKDLTIRMMEMAENFNHEFMKYRLGKGFWENVSKWTRRFNTIGVYGMIAAIALTGSPMAVWLLLAGVGINRYLNPYLDKWTSIAANRRNQARDITRKARQDALRMLENFEKGGNLTSEQKAEINDMLLDYDLQGEILQSVKVAEGWSPNKVFGLEFVSNAVFGDSGLLSLKGILGGDR